MIRKLIAFALLLTAMFAGAQTTVKNLKIEKQDGTRLVIPLAEISEMSVLDVSKESAVLEIYQRFAGSWYLVASPFEGGVVSIPFTAAIPDVSSSDYGHVLNCHSDAFLTVNGAPLVADWKLAFSYNTDTKKGQIGMILSAEEPVATIGETNIYMLSENIERHQLEGMTLWHTFTEKQSSDEMNEHAFLFPQQYQIYVEKAKGKPYIKANDEGWVDILASPRIQRNSYTPSVTE